MTNEEKLVKIIELLSEIQNPPESWNIQAKSKIIHNITEALRLALLMRV